MQRLFAFLATFLIFLLAYEGVSQSSEEGGKIDGLELKMKGDIGRLRPFMIPIIKNDEVIAYAMVTLNIQLSSVDEKVLDAVLQALPKVRDQIFIYLYNLFGVLWMPASKPDLVSMREKLLGYAKEHLGEHLKDLTISNVDVHQLKALHGEEKPFFIPQIVNP